MILTLHILLAIAGIVYTLSLLVGIVQRFAIAASLLGLTILSGVVLIMENPASLAHVCAAGVVYSAVTLALMAVARVRQRRRASQA